MHYYEKKTSQWEALESRLGDYSFGPRFLDILCHLNLFFEPMSSKECHKKINWRKHLYHLALIPYWLPPFFPAAEKGGAAAMKMDYPAIDTDFPSSSSTE